MTSRVTVLTADELDEIVRANSLLDVAKDPSRLLVAVLADPADRPKLVALTKQAWKPEAIAVGARAAYLWCPDGLIDSKLAASMAKAMGDGVTSRNWATVTKLAGMVAG